jgi:hypothetical protein
VALDDGYFTVVLGSGRALEPDDFDAGTVLIGVSIDGVELPVRQELHAVPYALRAGGVQLGNVATCNTGAAGTLRWDGSTLALCDGTRWASVRTTADGSTAAPAVSCRQLHEDWPQFPSDTYWLDPNGGSPADAFPAYCEMSIADGGWTRVAHLAVNYSVCGLGAALNTPADVAAGGSTTAWLSPAQVEAIGLVDREVLLVDTPTNWVRYSSAHADWTWTNVANGVINPSNVASYGVQYRRHSDSAFTALTSVNGCTKNGGSCLLSGYHTGGTWTIILGIGAYGRNIYLQDAACQTHPDTAPHDAMHNGGWNTDGDVYIR